jgi:hypothetical protein
MSKQRIWPITSPFWAQKKYQSCNGKKIRLSPRSCVLLFGFALSLPLMLGQSDSANGRHAVACSFTIMRMLLALSPILQHVLLWKLRNLMLLCAKKAHRFAFDTKLARNTRLWTQLTYFTECVQLHTRRVVRSMHCAHVVQHAHLITCCSVLSMG